MPSGPLDIRDRSYDELRGIAKQFLREHHPTGSVPVPIEEIIEFAMKLDIIPIEGLLTFFDIDGYVSRSFHEISVDQYIQETRPDRYRYVLADELAHVLIHREVVEQFQFETIEQWKAVILGVDRDDRSVYDGQAHELGCLILVPPAALKAEFEAAEKEASVHGITLPKLLAMEKGRLILESNLAKRFDVPRFVISDRANRDKLWPR